MVTIALLTGLADDEDLHVTVLPLGPDAWHAGKGGAHIPHVAAGVAVALHGVSVARPAPAVAPFLPASMAMIQHHMLAILDACSLVASCQHQHVYGKK